MGPLWCGHISRRAKESGTEGMARPKHSILDKQEGSHTVLSNLLICPSSPPPYILYVLRVAPTNVSNCSPDLSSLMIPAAPFCSLSPSFHLTVPILPSLPLPAMHSHEAGEHYLKSREKGHDTEGFTPLLFPSGPRSTVHSSMTPNGSKSRSTSSSDCCLFNMPTKSFLSPRGKHRNINLL